MNNFLLDFLALGAILSGILVITSKNPVISVLFLISVFVNVAGYLVLLGIGFIGISYLIVYVGAVAILFLFVVMMLNVQLAELSATGSEYTQNLPLGAIVGFLFLFELVSILPFSFKGLSTFNLTNLFNVFSEASLGSINSINMLFVSELGDNNEVHQVFDLPCAMDSNFSNFLQIQSIGQNLYTYGSIWLILTSIILLLAMVGPITLSINKSNELKLMINNPLQTILENMLDSIIINRNTKNKISVRKFFIIRIEYIKEWL
jgi:NADH-ubiquinone oxidoreductase chain 6